MPRATGPAADSAPCSEATSCRAFAAVLIVGVASVVTLTALVPSAAAGSITIRYFRPSPCPALALFAAATSLDSESMLPAG